MDSIIQNIYKPCDPTNSDSVPVSTLVDYIKPFMPNHLTELEDLQTQLDPDVSNPGISYAVFHEVMSGWIAKIQGDNSFADIKVGDEAPVGTFFNLSFNQSTDSNLSVAPANNNNASEETSEEKVCKLQHQLAKATSELDLVKQQLTNAEEHNETLLMDLNKLQKTCYHEQQVNEQFTKNQMEAEEIKEEANAANKKIWQLEKMLTSYERQQQRDAQQINQLETENAQLKSKLEKNDRNNREGRRSISDMRDALDIKDSEILTLTEALDELKLQLSDKTDLLTFYTKENDLLKERTQALEKLINELAPSGDATKPDLNESLRNIFNTPKLLRQLSNPISPSFMSPGTYTTSSPIKNGSSPTIELFSKVQTPKILRTPHKSLKEELAEATTDIGDEVKRLQQVLQEQEQIKNSLWQNMKRLATDNETLLEFKEELLRNIQEKEDTIEQLKNELETRETETFGDLAQQKQKIAELNQELEASEKAKKNLENELRQLVESKKTVEDKSVETDEWFFQTPATDPDVKKTNYAKQQLKLERLLEKMEKVEKDLAAERGINTTLQHKHQELNEELKVLTKDAEFWRSKTIKQTETIENLTSEMNLLDRTTEDLRQQILLLQSETNNLIAEKHSSAQNLQNALSRLAAESAVIMDLRRNNAILSTNQRILQAKRKEDFLKQINLKKQLINMRTAHDWKTIQMQKELDEKKGEIRNLKKQVEVDTVELFLSVNNRELATATSAFIDKFKFDDDIVVDFLNEIWDLQRQTSNLEKEMAMLNSNVKLIILIFEIVAEKFAEQAPKLVDVGCGDATFCISEIEESQVESLEEYTTCTSDLNDCTKELSEVIPFRYDSFLDNLELNDEDLRHLSRHEMEEKFRMLALTLTLDIVTANKRFLSQKEQLDRLLLKFFAYLNYSVDLLKRFNRSERSELHETAVTYLQLLKDLSEDAFKAAVTCGVLQYEKRTANCWNLVINYVAALSQENSQIKEKSKNFDVALFGTVSLDGCQIQPIERENVPQLSYKSRLVRSTKVFVFSFFLILVVVIMLFFYVDYNCPRDKFKCPVEWLVSSIIEQTYTNHI